MALLLLCTLRAAAWRQEVEVTQGPRAISPPGRPNLLLVTLDTTRADHLGSHGYARARTPHLDSLAAQGTRFARCDTAAPVTLPSHATILTGLYPMRHRVRDNGTFRLSAEFETLAERLASFGYDTAAVIGAVVLARQHGLDQGFRIYDDDLQGGYSRGTIVAERTAEEVAEAARAVLAGLRRPFFLWVHFFDPHEEYRPPGRFAGDPANPHRLYDGEVAYVDEQLGSLLDALPAETLVTVVGDHGEMLGEHGESTHGILLHAGVRRVPLIVAGPGIPAGRVHPCLVRTVDVFPTLVALAGLPEKPGLDGEPLFPLQARCGRMSYAEAFLPFYSYKWYPLRALSDGRFLYLDAPRPSLFRLDVDPAESRDEAARSPSLTRAWGKRLERLLAHAGEAISQATEPDAGLGPEQRAALASLGYLAGAKGSSVAIDRQLPDPRERLEIARALQAAARKVGEGKCSEVLPELRRIVREDPRNFPALTLAAQCLRDGGRCAEAVPLYERASREAEASAIPAVNLGACLVTLGREAEAEREFRRALVLDPALSEAAVRLGRLLRERSRTEEARRALDEALAAGARAAEVYLERGLALAELGRLESALADFREALRRNPADPAALENAARASFALNRPAEAALLYETLLQRSPEHLPAWKALGALYLERLNESEKARRAFQEALRREIDPAERARLLEVLEALSTGSNR